MHRYWALSLLSVVLKFIGIISLVMSLFFGLAVLVGLTAAAPVLGVGGALVGLFFILFGLVYGLAFYAGGQFIVLMIDIERNTRATAVRSKPKGAPTKPPRYSLWDDDLT